MHTAIAFPCHLAISLRSQLWKVLQRMFSENRGQTRRHHYVPCLGHHMVPDWPSLCRFQGSMGCHEVGKSLSEDLDVQQ